MIACRFLTEATFEGMQGKLSFGKRFISAGILRGPYASRESGRSAQGRSNLNKIVQALSADAALAFAHSLSVCSWPAQGGHEAEVSAPTLIGRATT